MKCHHVFQLVPDEEMDGDEIRPLCQLPKRLQTIYKQKYKGREMVLDTPIPMLDCTWSDVTFFTSVPPFEWLATLGELGIAPPKMRFFQIKAHMLDPSLAVVLTYGRDGREIFIPFNLENLHKYADIPRDARAYYDRTIARGGRPWLHHLVPQVLYKGTVYVGDAQIIEL